MPQYFISYHGGRAPESPEQGAKQMAEWKAWLDNLGDAVINPGTPLMNGATVTSANVSTDGAPFSMAGFSVIEAADMDAILEIAKACPMLAIDGTLGVAEMKQM